METTDFTFEQIQKYQRYEQVRQSGAHNMFMPQARAATGLSAEDYAFVMTNYSELRKQAEAENE